MKLIPLSKTGKKNAGKYFAMVDDDMFDFLNQWNWSILSGNKGTLYASRNTLVNGKQVPVLMHRLVLGNEKNGLEVDHIDGNTFNNQRSNLRYCTRAENMRNKRPSKSGTSPFLGVYIDRSRSGKERIRAAIKVDGKRKLLGDFKTQEDAARARDAAAIQIHGAFAKLNFPVL